MRLQFKVFFWVLGFFVGSIQAGFEPPMPVSAPIPILSKEEGADFLKLFHSQAIQRDYNASITLSPKGSKPLWEGKICAVPSREGACLFLECKALQDDPAFKKYLLIQGSEPMALQLLAPCDLDKDFYQQPPSLKKKSLEAKVSEGKALWIPHAEWLNPFLKGLSITIFDFLMPFLFWPGEYYKSTTLKGRIVHQFDLQVPADFESLLPKNTVVRMSIDSGFKALMEMSIIQDKKTLHLLRANSIKKTNERWFLKSAEQALPLQKQKTLLVIEHEA